MVAGLLFLILIFLATFPLYSSRSDVLVLTIILMYIILTVSWAMFSGSTGYMSLAAAAFFGVGVYTSALLFSEKWALLPLPAVIVIAGIASFVLALLVGFVTLRLKGIYFAIFTFGLVVLIRQLLVFWELQIVGKRGQHVIAVGGDTVYYVMLGILVVTLVTVYLIRRSRLGLAMQSIGGNEEAAAHMGVNTTRVKVLTFGISAIFMGAAGAIMATRWIYVDPASAFNVFYSFMPVLMAVFGGMGQLYGPVIGAAIFAYTERTLRLQSPYYYMLAFGIILILVILYLPGGLVSLVPKLRNRLGALVSKFWKGGKAEQRANT
ncbi:MAG: branched-chain amino acid ABC transporter permease [Dehalococcoidia bacterium]